MNWEVPHPWRWCVGNTETGITATAWKNVEPYRDENGGIIFREVVVCGGTTIEEAFINMVERIKTK